MLVLALEKTRPPKKGRMVNCQVLGLGPGVPRQAGRVRRGNTTILVATEQLREAIQDVAALKDAVTDLKDSVWSDERGKPPLNDNLDDDDEYRDYEPSLPPTPAIVIPAGSQQPSTPAAQLPRLPPRALQQSTTNVLNLSPTNSSAPTTLWRPSGC